MDQFPESRSIVLREEFPGDFSVGTGPGPDAPFMFAVKVDMEGRV
jgi:hypothetical protein